LLSIKAETSIYINGKTGKYLEPSPGKANLNIFAMAREEIRFELGKAIREASSQNIQIIANLLYVRYGSGIAASGSQQHLLPLQTSHVDI